MKSSGHKATNDVVPFGTPEREAHELVQPFPPVSVMRGRIYGHWRRQDRTPNSSLPLKDFMGAK